MRKEKAVTQEEEEEEEEEEKCIFLIMFSESVLTNREDNFSSTSDKTVFRSAAYFWSLNSGKQRRVVECLHLQRL